MDEEGFHIAQVPLQTCSLVTEVSSPSSRVPSPNPSPPEHRIESDLSSSPGLESYALVHCIELYVYVSMTCQFICGSCALALRCWICSIVADHPNADPTTIFPDGRFNHVQQVNDRLRFLRFLLKDGQLWLCKQQATEASCCSII